MKKGWTYKKLGEVCDINFGTRVVKSRDAGSVYPVYGGGGATFKIDIYNREDCMVISRFGMSEQCTRFVRGKFFLNDSGLTLSTNKNIINQDFLNWEVYSLNNVIFSLGRGAAQKNLDTKALSEIIVSYPNSLSEQQRIVSRVDAAFAHIDELKAKAEKQLSEARTLFQKALEKAMEPRKGWEEMNLQEITNKIGSGATPKGGKKVYINEGVSLVRSMNVHNAIFKYDDLAHINDDAAQQLIGVELKTNDVLFNITGASIARCCIVPENILPGRVNQHVSILRPIMSIISPKFLCLLLLSRKHQEDLLAIGVAGSTRQAITKADLENHKVIIPSILEQQRIVERLDSLSSHVHELEENLKKTMDECDALKQALLRKVFKL